MTPLAEILRTTHKYSPLAPIALGGADQQREARRGAHFVEGANPPRVVIDLIVCNDPHRTFPCEVGFVSIIRRAAGYEARAREVGDVNADCCPNRRLSNRQIVERH